MRDHYHAHHLLVNDEKEAHMHELLIFKLRLLYKKFFTFSEVKQVSLITINSLKEEKELKKETKI